MNIEERLDRIEKQIREILTVLKEKKETKTPYKSISSSKVEVRTYAEILKGLANPIRIMILNKLAKEGELYYTEIQKITGLPPATLNFHLRTLKSSYLIYQDSSRGKYFITELGKKLLETLKQLANALYNYETVELDRYCFVCGKAKMKVDVYPTHFKVWCPVCGGEHGSKWSFDGINPFGEEWKRYGLEELIEKGLKETYKLIRESMDTKRCINCNAQIKYVFKEDRIEGKCQVCGQSFSMQINDLTLDRLLPLWKKYKKISQKTEGPVEKNGFSCWKITVFDQHGKIIATQFLEVGTGKEIAWEEHI